MARLMKLLEIVLFSVLIVAVFMMVWCAGEDNSTVVVCLVVAAIILVLISLGSLRSRARVVVETFRPGGSPDTGAVTVVNECG